MTARASPLVLSEPDRARIEHADALSALGAESVPALIAMLDDKSWAVRRAVIAALSSMGDPAVRPLCEVLRTRRDDEGRVAAAVDTLAASLGESTDREVMKLLAPGGQGAVICDAAQVLGRRKSAAAADALSGLTSHGDDNVALAAIEALGRIGGGAGLEALVVTVQGDNFFRIFPAIDVLGRSGDPHAVEPLVGLLGKPLYALEAARALGRTGDLGAVRPLAEMLSRASDALARVAAAALWEIRERAGLYFASTEMVEEEVRAAADAVRMVQRLKQAVASASPEEQDALCRVLSWLRHDSVAEALIALLDVAPGAAAGALRSLGRDSDAQLLHALRNGDSARRLLLLPLVGGRAASSEPVLGCLDDPDPAVRALACNALARIGDAQAVPRLFALLSDPAPLVSQAVVGAIQSLGSATTERLALEAARSPVPAVCRAALRIVAYFGYPAGLDVLLAALNGDDDRLREVALLGLPFMDDPRALAALIEAAQSPRPRVRAAAMRALGQGVDGPEALRVLRRGLDDADAWVRYYACQSLGKARDAAATDAILRLTQDPAGQVRVAAVEALAPLGTPAALEGLRVAAVSNDPDVQRAALAGLGVFKRPDALPTLVIAARSGDVTTRLVAIAALAGYEVPTALAVLASAATDPEESVRQAAIGFLAHRNEPAATDSLIGLLGNPLARTRAIEALATGAHGRTEHLLLALRTSNAELSAALMAVLAREAARQGPGPVSQALELANPHARRAAAAALSAHRTEEAKALLERAANHDPDPGVRRIGRLALAR